MPAATKCRFTPKKRKPSLTPSMLETSSSRRVLRENPWSVMKLLCSLTPMGNCSSTGTRTVTGWLVCKYRREILSTSSPSPSPGGVVGNNKKGIYLRSQDPDRSSFIQECPCQVGEESTGRSQHHLTHSIADQILAET